MKKTNSVELKRNKNIKRVCKLACGQSFYIEDYGRINAYRAKNGKRMFSISESDCVPVGGNISLERLLSYL